MDWIIRPATLDDVNRLTEMGRFFHAEANLQADYSEPVVASFLSSLIEQPETALILVIEVNGRIEGMCGAMLYPVWYNTASLTGQEVFWWVEAPYRGSAGIELLRQMTDWARRKGAETFSMVALENDRHQAMTRLYRQHGFTPMEQVFTKRF